MLHWNGASSEDVKDERVQCLRCLQDKKYRVKPPKVDQVAQLALWDARGVQS